MRGLSRSRTRLFIALATVALFFSFSANVAQTLQAHRNCHNIELLKTNTRLILIESYKQLINGDQDEAFRKFYGKGWEVKKADAILAAEKRIQRFNPSNCPWFIH